VRQHQETGAGQLSLPVLLTVGRAEHLPSGADLSRLRLRPQPIWVSGDRAPAVGDRGGALPWPRVRGVPGWWHRGTACGPGRRIDQPVFSTPLSPGAPPVVAPELARTHKTSASTGVLCDCVVVAASSPRSRSTRTAPSSAADDGGYEQWPYLDEEVLVASRSRKVCLTCHWFRHHAGVNCIPVLTCQLHQGLLAHGEHITRRCQSWTKDLARQRGVASWRAGAAAQEPPGDQPG
jgi:hypothetical protein